MSERDVDELTQIIEKLELANRKQSEELHEARSIINKLRSEIRSQTSARGASSVHMHSASSE